MVQTKSSIGSRKQTAFDKALTSIEQKFSRDTGPAIGGLGAWAEETPIILDGRPFSFHRHEYLITPYADDHPHVVEIKAAQMGLTTKAMLKALYAARYLNFRGILYLFPSRTDVTEFAKGRIDPLIEDNPDTMGKWLQDTDSANIKQIWNCFLYLRGMKSRVGLKSIPVDFIELFSHFIDPADILHQFRTTNNLTEFYNLKLGMAYVEATNRLSVQEVLALCGDEGNASSDPGPCSMGVDQGKILHVVIGKREWQRAGKIVHVGEYEAWEQLDRLMKIFNVSRAVVDALPETRNARAFAERHKGKVFLSYYSEHQKSGYKWNDGDLTVHSNRTESLDASHVEIQFARIALPRECDIIREFAGHCSNTAKKLEEDEETGSKRYVYVKLGQDHFRHAFNYEAMARHYGAGSLFADCIF